MNSAPGAKIKKIILKKKPKTHLHENANAIQTKLNLLNIYTINKNQLLKTN